MHVAYEQQTVVFEESFLDENKLPLALKEGYPRAKIRYNGADVIRLSPESIGNGRYSVQAVIPEFGFNEPTPIALKWRAYTTDGNLVKINSVILVQPTMKPHIGDIVVMEDELEVVFNIPIRIPENSNPKYAFYQNNDLIERKDFLEHQLERFSTYTQIKFEHRLQSVFVPYLMTIDFRSFDNKKERLMQNIWVVTPQMLNAMNLLEGSLNKARLDNVIPQLEYTQADLLTYLQRGLALFNTYSPNLMDFNGRNMQGGLLDILVLCGSYYALGAQLLAEGMLAFDFTGQAVTLNVDRTPALEGALGRVEQQMTERVPRLKQMLLRRGVTGGEGSDNVGNSSGLGITVLSNSPTTSRHVWRPGLQNYYR